MLAFGCAPARPTIDGVAGAPPSPAAPWIVPPSARTPAPTAAPPISPAASVAFDKDSAATGAVRLLELPDIVDLALHNSPATRESWEAARAAADAYGSSRGALFPTVDASVNLLRASSSSPANTGGAIFNGNPSDTLGGGSGNGVITGGITRSVFTPALSLSYLVFDLGGRSGTIQTAKSRAIAANLAHNAAVSDAVLQVESTLFGFLAARAMRDAQILAVQEAQTDTASSVERFRVGVATLEEVLQTRTALAQARFQLATLEGSVLATRANLALAMGLQANARFDVPNVVPADSVAGVAASVDTLVNRAITGRPELAQARAEADALAAQIRVARAAGYPSLTVNSTVNSVESFRGNTGGVPLNRNFSLLLGVQIPIFSGFSTQYDVRSAREQYEAGLAHVRTVRQQISVQVFVSYAALQTAKERVHAANEELESALQSSDVAVGRYREGVGTVVDVVLARRALATGRSDVIQAAWEWRTALAQLAHDVGALDQRGRARIPLGPAMPAGARR